jgi:hypothetical protein
LAGYGVGPNLLRLQKQFWGNAKMVCCAGGNIGEPFSAGRGVTQGGPLPGLMFNVCVDALVREWLRQVLGDDTAQGGLGEAACNHVVAFFVDNRLVLAKCPEWLQSSFTILVNLLERIGHQTNAAKMKVMTCLLGKIRVARTEEEYTAQQTGNATTTKRQGIDCKVCGNSLAAESLQSHLETQHNIYRSFVLNRDLVPKRAAVSTVLLNRQPPASTHARCHSVAATQAPGSTYANIFLCNIPRISCASQSRVPYPCQSAHIVDRRPRWRTSAEVIIAQGCARGGGRGNANMRLLCVPNVPSIARLVQMGKSWRG